MKKVLLVYSTREGQTEKVAQKIEQHLLSQKIEVLVFNAAEIPKNIQVSDFDFVLCGGSMHAGGIESELVKFISKNENEIQSKPNAFFLVLLSAATKDPKLREQWLSDALKKMKEQIKCEFKSVETIAGALAYSKYPWPLKLVMKRIARQAGEDTDTSHDYEYTDWNQVAGFAQRVSAQL